MRSSWNERVLTTAAVLITLAAVGMASLRFIEYRDRREGVSHRGTQVRDPNEYSRAGIRVGPREAPVKVVEFSDFQCPFCRDAASDLKELRERYSGQILFVYRHLPGHAHSEQAAAAAECAAEQGKFESLHDSLFAKADSIGLLPWAVWARRTGIPDSSAFISCLADARTSSRIEMDISDARRFAVTGTPTILVASTRFESNPGVERMSSVVKARLEELSRR